MGVFEVEPFARGPGPSPKRSPPRPATTVVGGGDSAAALTRSASPTSVTTCRRAAARRWSCSKARSCPAWRRSSERLRRRRRRTPLIAGNWKMHKTVAEAERLHHRRSCRSVSRGRRVEVAICPPFTGAAGDGRGARGSRREGVRAEHASGEPGRLHRRGVGADADRAGRHGVVLGHSERRELLRRDRPASWPTRCRPRSTRGSLPILCVGETEDERESGDTERKLATRCRRTWRRVETERLGEVVIAYEPIWAIGTGQGRDAGAGAGGDRVHPRARRRPLRASRRERARILYGGSVKPDNAARAARAARRRRRARGRREPRRRAFAAIVAAAR